MALLGEGDTTGAGWGRHPQTQPPGRAGRVQHRGQQRFSTAGRGSADPGAPVPRGGGCPGSAGSVFPIPVPSFCALPSSPGVSAGRCGKTPPPRAGVGVSGMRRGGQRGGAAAVAQLKGRRGLQRGSAPGEVQDGRNTPRARPAPSFTPWHRRRGGGEGRVLGEPGTALQRTGMGGMDRSEFPQGGEAAASFPPALQLPFSPLQ